MDDSDDDGGDPRDFYDNANKVSLELAFPPFARSENTKVHQPVCLGAILPSTICGDALSTAA